MFRTVLTGTCVFLSLNVALSAETWFRPAEFPLSVKDGMLCDPQGRQVLLWGMNVGEKSSARRHLSWHGPEDYHNLRRWGMNAVRMLIFWSAIEPEPGKYDEAYLASLDERIGWARDAGLHIILDMHQDLWSEAVPGGNGAPAWATLHDGQPHDTIGNVWSTAYFVSPMVHRAFDNFWNNAPGPDGVGLQDRFALAWRHVAERYANRSEVIGFDLMNEPFPGSRIQEAGAAIVLALPEILEGVDLPDGFQGLLDSAADGMPPWLLEALDNPERHKRAVAAIAPTMQQFEREHLMPMYQRVHQAIREVSPNAIIFLEPCVLANVGVPSVITPLTNADGTPDPFQVYFPHAYDIVTDTPLSHQPSENRLNLILSHKRQDADRLGMSVFIGEWGALYGSPKTRNAGRLANRLIEKYAHGAFYWEYHQGIDKTVYFEVLAKPAPLYLSGVLKSYGFSPEDGAFTCRWETGSAGQTSIFAAPLFWSPDAPRITIAPETLSVSVEYESDDDQSRRVVVISPDVPVEATITLVPATRP